MLGMENTKEKLVPLFQSAKVHPFLFEALLNDETQQFISQHRKALKQYLDTKKTILDKIFMTAFCDCKVFNCHFFSKKPERSEWSYSNLLIHYLRTQLEVMPTYWSLLNSQPCKSPDQDLCEVEKIKAAQKKFDDYSSDE
ncbi:hypothetical protein HMI54_005794 [Coelomomyces lativittatus]|nr:hypothetical protein HMI55_002271 [Coelomomyces lativittatus]KAJ1512161.1 hypothetical protein HMI56_004429 [Coelomomyces lativittatus]KAJ1517389.1 hypothetical protein HMI54_005794 [Coelomomyces lativittatus]